MYYYSLTYLKNLYVYCTSDPLKKHFIYANISVGIGLKTNKRQFSFLLVSHLLVVLEWSHYTSRQTKVKYGLGEEHHPSSLGSFAYSS